MSESSPFNVIFADCGRRVQLGLLDTLLAVGLL